MTEEANGKNGVSLAKMLNQLNLPTLIAVSIFGGGNWLATKEDGRLTRDEARHVISQVNDLHQALDDFERRQKDQIGKAATALDNQNQILKNQSMMISNQQQLITNLNKRIP